MSPWRFRHGSPNDHIAIGFSLCFAVLGRTGDRATQPRHDVHHIHTSTNDVSLHHQVELFWESESLGTTKPYKSMSVEDRHAVNGLLTAQFQSRMTIIAWVSFGNMIHLSFPSTAPWLKYALVTSSDACKQIKTCMKGTVQLLMVTLPRTMPVSSLKKRLIEEITRLGIFLTTRLPAPTSQARFLWCLMQPQSFKALH